MPVSASGERLARSSMASAQLVFPIELVGREGDEAALERRLGVERAGRCAPSSAATGAVAAEARRRAASAVDHRVRPEVQRAERDLGGAVASSGSASM